MKLHLFTFLILFALSVWSSAESGTSFLGTRISNAAVTVRNGKILDWEKLSEAETFGILLSRGPIFVNGQIIKSVATAQLSADEIDALGKRVPSSYSVDSVDDAIHLIEERTGFKVSFPEEFFAAMRTFPIKGKREGKSDETVGEFLNNICNFLALKWKLDAKSKTVVLDFGWRKSDPGKPSDLLPKLSQHESWGSRDHYATDAKWQADLDELLSAPSNFDKAWKVRQQSNYEEFIFQLLAGFPNSQERQRVYSFLHPLLVRRMAADSLKEAYILVTLVHPIVMYPGRGSLSYYWFKEDGTLMGAGLMNTGHRHELIEATVEPSIDDAKGWPPPFRSRSELQLILQVNKQSFHIARFVLGKEGLKLISLTDATGTAVDARDWHIGESLVTPVKNQPIVKKITATTPGNLLLSATDIISTLWKSENIDGSTLTIGQQINQLSTARKRLTGLREIILQSITQIDSTPGYNDPYYEIYIQILNRLAKALENKPIIETRITRKNVVESRKALHSLLVELKSVIGDPLENSTVGMPLPVGDFDTSHERTLRQSPLSNSPRPRGELGLPLR